MLPSKVQIKYMRILSYRNGLTEVLNTAEDNRTTLRILLESRLFRAVQIDAKPIAS